VPAEFCVHNLGCKVNRVESDVMTATLLAAGGVEVKRDDAHLVIVNTCTVTGEAETKTRKAIRQALSGVHEPWVIATGCAVAVNQSAYEALGDKVIAEPSRTEAIARALNLLGLTVATSATPQRIGANFNRRMGIKIQDGCDNRCTYCIVPTARGVALSTPLAEVLAQVVAAEQSGVREVILTGVNIGRYSSDNAGLAELAETLLSATTELRLRLSSIEPEHATNRLLALMAASDGRLCAHLHLPLQSGCDTTLASMGRLYDTSVFEDRVTYARNLMPHLALTTDVIVGFPGEADEDFRCSYEFCERMRFSRMHVFRYSKRPGTPAAGYPNQVPPQVSAARATALRELSAQLQAADLTARIGTTEQVLVERSGRGTSESYHQVLVPADSVIGSLAIMQFTSLRDTLLLGTQTEEN
jgi:threonylcarbamoyladenosine tRNA methylthiotransferase MtaB